MKKPAAAGAKAAAAKKHHAAAHKTHHGAAHHAHPKHPHAKAAKTVKHHAAAKKTQHVKAHKPRRWSPDETVALCSARAVAEAFRIVSGPVLSDADVLGLYWSTASNPDEGQTLSDALSAARCLRHQQSTAGQGLFRRLDVGVGQVISGGSRPFTGWECVVAGCHDVGQSARRAFPRVLAHALILGLDLPWGEPHAVTVDIDGTWWSWGEPHTPDDFPGAIIEEAWAVTLA